MIGSPGPEARHNGISFHNYVQDVFLPVGKRGPMSDYLTSKAIVTSDDATGKVSEKVVRIALTDEGQMPPAPELDVLLLNQLHDFGTTDT